jgi:hypothetical protein
LAHRSGFRQALQAQEAQKYNSRRDSGGYSTNAALGYTKSGGSFNVPKFQRSKVQEFQSSRVGVAGGQVVKPLKVTA